MTPHHGAFVGLIFNYERGNDKKSDTKCGQPRDHSKPQLSYGLFKKGHLVDVDVLSPCKLKQAERVERTSQSQQVPVAL